MMQREPHKEGGQQCQPPVLTLPLREKESCSQGLLTSYNVDEAYSSRLESLFQLVYGVKVGHLWGKIDQNGTKSRASSQKRQKIAEKSGVLAFLLPSHKSTREANRSRKAGTKKPY